MYRPTTLCLHDKLYDDALIIMSNYSRNKQPATARFYVLSQRDSCLHRWHRIRNDSGTRTHTIFTQPDRDRSVSIHWCLLLPADQSQTNATRCDMHSFHCTSHTTTRSPPSSPVSLLFVSAQMSLARWLGSDFGFQWRQRTKIIFTIWNISGCL